MAPSLTLPRTPPTPGEADATEFAIDAELSPPALRAER